MLMIELLLQEKYKEDNDYKILFDAERQKNIELQAQIKLQQQELTMFSKENERLISDNKDLQDLYAASTRDLQRYRNDSLALEKLSETHTKIIGEFFVHLEFCANSLRPPGATPKSKPDNNVDIDIIRRLMRQVEDDVIHSCLNMTTKSESENNDDSIVFFFKKNRCLMTMHA